MRHKFKAYCQETTNYLAKYNFNTNNVILKKDIDAAMAKLTKSEIDFSTPKKIYIYSSVNIPRYIIRAHENMQIVRKKENADYIVCPSRIKPKRTPWRVSFALKDNEYIIVARIPNVIYPSVDKHYYAHSTVYYISDSDIEYLDDVLSADEEQIKKFISAKQLYSNLFNNQDTDWETIEAYIQSEDEATRKLALKLMIQTDVSENKVKIYQFVRKYQHFFERYSQDNSVKYISEILNINPRRNSYLFVNSFDKYKHEYDELSVTDKKLMIEDYLDHLKREVNRLRNEIDCCPFELSINLTINDSQLNE